MLLQELLATGVLRPGDWERLSPEQRDPLTSEPSLASFLQRLSSLGLVTAYQAQCLSEGRPRDLILGQYRILDCLGKGGMGRVLKAEHRRLERLVAIKVLGFAHDQRVELLQRFLTEMKVIAQLRHPNIVFALDAGEVPSPDLHMDTLHYLVMEYVPGQDLEHLVRERGPIPLAQACELGYQIASALQEAHRHNLVHRDVKPSNIMVTPEGQAKLLDFGITRQFGDRHTDPGTVLGSVSYLAPEQARDASRVDIRADIYGLGGVLFWCLTGQTPFPSRNRLVEELAQRQVQAPPAIRTIRPDLPVGLEAVIARMMALDPDDRYAAPQAVMRALMPFFGSLPGPSRVEPLAPAESSEGTAQVAQKTHRVLLVDDEAPNRVICRLVLQPEGIVCDEAADGAEALALLHARPYDLVVLDVSMPRMTGIELLRALRERPPSAYLKVLMVSGETSTDEMAKLLGAGADDYLAKPLSLVQLKARVHAALRLKELQERSDLLMCQLLESNQQLEQHLHARDSDLVHARNALVLALAELVHYRDIESGDHLARMQRYSRTMAEAAAGEPSIRQQVDENFIGLLECCAPLHDIGKVGLPDHILLKPGRLLPEERIIMQTHTTIGARVLEKVAQRYPFARVFLQMATDITRHHHECWDGSGYPDRLAGEAIPLAARIVMFGDIYDALRSRRVYKPALTHADTVRLMVAEGGTRFDPVLTRVFEQRAPQFEKLFVELGG